MPLAETAHSNVSGRAITEALIALGRKLKLEVIEEGIESEDAPRYLQEDGWHQVQGFWFSKPLPASEVVQWCRRERVEY